MKVTVVGTRCVGLVTGPWSGFGEHFSNRTFVRTPIHPPIFFDGRNILKPVAAREAGFEYPGIGQP